MDDFEVCHVNEQGELICDDKGLTKGTQFDQFQVVLQPLNLSAERLELIVYLMLEVIGSPLTNECIASRSDEAVKSVRYVLDHLCPTMSLYKYSPLPGRMLATYAIEQGNFETARQALDHWAVLKECCNDVE